MSKPIVYLITFVVCALLQVAVSPAISIAGCSPNFLLIPVLLVSTRSGAGAGSVAGFACGLFEDFAGNGTVGCMALVFTIVALVVGLLSSGVGAPGALLSCIIAVVSSFVVEIGYGFANVLTSAEGNGVLVTMVTHALPSALYSAVFACIALVTIRLVLADDSPSMPSRLGQGYGSSAKMPKFTSRLK